MATRFGMRITDDSFVEMLDEYRRTRKSPPSRSEVVRELVQIGFETVCRAGDPATTTPTDTPR